MFGSLFVLALRSMRVRMLRSMLTVLGIIIGIIFIVALLSLGDGLKNAVVSQMGGMGSDLIFVFAGEEGTSPASAALYGIKITKSDLNIIKQTDGIKTAHPLATESFTMEFGEEKEILTVRGISKAGTELFKSSQGFELETGRWFDDRKYDLVIGSRLAKKMFDKEISTGDRVLLNGKKFTVIGILKEMGEQADDSAAYTSYDTVSEVTGEEKMFIIISQVYPGANANDVAEKIKKKMKDAHGGVEDFSVYTNEKALEMVNSVLSIVQFFITGIAAVALVVGAVGIMNTVYMTVYERTKEIGIMKAIGAKKLDIISMFVIESGLIGLIGGIIGMIIGFGLAKIVEIIAAQSGYGMLKASMSIEFIFSILAFSFIVGILAGLLPAKTAAEMEPVEALRYE